MAKRRPKEPVERSPKLPMHPALAQLPKRVSDALGPDPNYTEFAERMGVSVPFVTRLVNGQQFSGIQASYLLWLADALNVHPLHLLTGEVGPDRNVVTDGSSMADAIAARVLAGMNQASAEQLPNDKPARASQKKR